MSLPLAAIAFDAYGTLFDVYGIGATADRLVPGRGTELAALWRDKQIEYTRLRTLSGRYVSFWQCTEDALDHAVARLGLALDAASRSVLLDAYAHLEAFPENLEALTRLRGMGLPLAILTNANPEMLDAAVDASGMRALFDHLLSADTVRRFKTAPEVYQLGPVAFGVPASRILFVSSNGWDVAGATWFGYTTFWVNRAGLPAERLGVDPAGEGRGLDDVVDFVTRAQAPAR
jgi:2-haloacid dehalogenase